MYNGGVHGIRSLTNGRQRHRVNTSKQITLESNRGIRSIHAISKTVRPQIAGIIDLLRAIDERTAHHRNTTCIATHMRVGTHQSHCHIKIQHHNAMQFPEQLRNIRNRFPEPSSQQHHRMSAHRNQPTMWEYARRNVPNQPPQRGNSTMYST